jgi:hypothetical protein
MIGVTERIELVAQLRPRPAAQNPQVRCRLAARARRKKVRFAVLIGADMRLLRAGVQLASIIPPTRA